MSVCGYLGKTSQEQHSVTENVFSCALDTLIAPWIHFCHPGYTYVTLDTLMSPWKHLCRPGYTSVTLDTLVSPWLHLCCPGPTYVTLDTLLPTWIQFCRPGYTQIAGGYTYVALDTIMSPWRHILYVSCVVQPPFPPSARCRYTVRFFTLLSQPKY